MRKVQLSLILGTVILLIVAGLLVGCCGPRSLAPEITPTGAGAQAAPPGEGTPTPDVMLTAMAESTRAAQTAAAEQGDVMTSTVEPTVAPTSPPATIAPTVESPTLVPTMPAPTTPPSGGTITYVVQPGDNLFRIALRHGTTFEELARINGIANPALIYVGQVLTIPAGGVPQPGGGTTYVVQPGDNLFRIALRHNMSYVYLAQYNGIANPARIYVGQVIRIPPR